MVVAHPFRRAFTADFQSGEKPTPLTLETAIQRPVFGLVDGVEVCNGASADRENRFAIDACEALGLSPTGGSDAHSDLGIGCYATQFDDPIRTEADVIAALKQRRCRAVVLQKHRTVWTYEPSHRIATKPGPGGPVMSPLEARRLPRQELPAVEEHSLQREPYYLSIADEVDVFLAAYEARLPVLLKGPTGCGKTRFVEYMAYQLYRCTLHADAERLAVATPLITVACHEDLSASDIAGRYLLVGEETGG
jgi:hypothetical protein